MKLPDDIRRLLLRRYDQHHRNWLAADAEDPPWPLTIALGVPTEQQAVRQPDAVRAWADAWRVWRGAGELQWIERRWKILGVQSLPEALRLNSAAEVANWLGEEQRWQLARQRFALMTTRWPVLAQRLSRLYAVLAGYDETDFQRLLALVSWLDEHRDSGLYPRQLPLPGIDSKWLEPRKAIVVELVAALRGANTGDADFYALCGLARPPTSVRLRILDPALRAHVGGLGDLSAPPAQLADIGWQPVSVIIVENLQTGLALGDLPGAVAFMGLGYGVELLAQLPWVHTANCLYWGDIDTHGYAILNQARACFPHLISVLMDEATLRRHAALWTQEKTQHAADSFPLLTEQETAVYGSLKNHTHGPMLRLEQERIAWDIAWPALRAAALTRPTTPPANPPA